MAELEIRLASGGLATIKGSPEEVANILRLAGIGGPAAPGAPSSGSAATKSPRIPTKKVKSGSPKKKAGPVDRIMELQAEAFFKTPKALGDIQEALKTHGYIYAVTSLSPAVVRLVRSKRLRRLKNKKGLWTYVQP